MNIELIKTSSSDGAVFVKYRRHSLSPEQSITLPFCIKDDSMVEFRISEEALGDLVNLIKILVLNQTGIEE